MRHPGIVLNDLDDTIRGQEILEAEGLFGTGTLIENDSSFLDAASAIPTVTVEWFAQRDLFQECDAKRRRCRIEKVIGNPCPVEVATAKDTCILTIL